MLEVTLTASQQISLIVGAILALAAFTGLIVRIVRHADEALVTKMKDVFQEVAAEELRPEVATMIRSEMTPIQLRVAHNREDIQTIAAHVDLVLPQRIIQTYSTDDT